MLVSVVCNQGYEIDHSVIVSRWCYQIVDFDVSDNTYALVSGAHLRTPATYALET